MSGQPNSLFMKAGNSSQNSISPYRNYVYTNDNAQSRSPYVAPYKNGKKISKFISPTFMSGDCFYPQIPFTPPKMATTPTKFTKLQQNYYEKSHRTVATTPKQVTPRAIESTPLTPSKRSEPQNISSKSVHEPFENYNNYIEQQSNQKTPTHSPLSSKKMSQHQKSDASSSKISEMVCPDCYNKEIATTSKKREQIMRYNDLNYIEAITHIDQMNMKKEKEQEQKIKNIERQLIKEQYEQFLKSQQMEKLQKMKDKEDQRQIEETIIKQEREKRFLQTQLEKQKKESFLNGIRNQIEERDQRKKKLLANMENQNSRSFAIGEEYDQVALKQQRKEYEKQILKEQRDQKLIEKELQKHSFELQQKTMQKQLASEIEQYEQKKKEEELQKKKTQQKQLQNFLDKAISENNVYKQKEREQDKQIYQHIQQLDDFEKQKQQIEIYKEAFKKQQFIEGLNEQIQEKLSKKSKPPQQIDLPFVDLNRSFDFLQKPSEFTQIGQCQECSKSCLKDYLTKIRKSKPNK